MNYQLKTKSGLTLTEMAVVIATIALLVAFGLPAVRVLLDSFESGDAGKSMISAALSSARAIAASGQRFAGIRFQQDSAGNQYMVFIVHDFEKTGLSPGFRAVEGLKPIKLPDSIGVMDLTIVTKRNVQNPVNSGQVRLNDPLLGGDDRINESFEITDTTTFSIIFSPTGKLVIHGVRVRNKDGRTDDNSSDDIFNTKNNVDAKIGMFYQDDYFGAGWSPYPDLGLGPEPSRNSFIIYDREKFRQAYKIGRAWSNYLAGIVPQTTYINPYTGTIINQ